MANGSEYEKRQVNIFNKSGRKLTGSKFTFLNKPMEVVNKYCYLGIDLYPKGSFRTSVANLMNKARKVMSPLFSTIAQFQLPCSNGINLFNSLIKPRCLYDAEHLAHLSRHQIESLQEKRGSTVVHDASRTFQSTIEIYGIYVRSKPELL